MIVALGTSISQAYPAPEFVFLNERSTAGTFFLVLVVAPFVEEGLKASGVYAYRDRLRRPADGPVLGASVGLGFGFFETFLYGLGAFLVGGLAAGLSLILVRSVSSVVLHGSSTGMFGHGFARGRLAPGGPGAGAYYLLAVGMHATFNALASLAVLLALVGVHGVASEAASLVALVAAIAFAFGAIERTLVAHGEVRAEEARPVARMVLGYFGLDDTVLDNKLSSEDRDRFYQLEEEGLLTSEEEDATVSRGKTWRYHTWLLNMPGTRDGGHRGESGPAPDEGAVYRSIDEADWRRKSEPTTGR